jgi:hypothetical protein
MDLSTTRQESKNPLLGAITAYLAQIIGGGHDFGASIFSLVEGHLCEFLTEVAQGRFSVIVETKSLEEWAGSCRECSFLLKATGDHLAGRDWTDTALTIIDSYPRDVFFVSGRDKAIVKFNHTLPFFLATNAGIYHLMYT